MTTLFATAPGRVSVLPEDIPTGLIMAIGGQVTDLAIPGRGSFFSMRAIITAIDVGQVDDYQVQSSMNAQRYAYVFGRGIGDARIGGIAFSDSCTDVVDPSDPNTNGTPSIGTGIERICNYFDESRISNSGQVFDMVLGMSAAARFKLLMHNLQINLNQPELRLTEFAINCKVFR